MVRECAIYDLSKRSKAGTGLDFLFLDIKNDKEKSGTELLIATGIGSSIELLMVDWLEEMLGARRFKVGNEE